MAGTRYYKLPTGIGAIVVWDGANIDAIAALLGSYETISFDHSHMTIGDDQYNVGDGFTMTDDEPPVYGGRIAAHDLVRDVLSVDAWVYVDPSNAGSIIGFCNGRDVKFHAETLYVGGKVVADGDAVAQCGSGIVIIPAATLASDYTEAS